MRETFNFNTLSFDDVPTPSHRHHTFQNLCATKDISDLATRYAHHFDDDGADVIPNLAEAMMKKVINGVNFDRKPLLTDAFDAFYWILGRTPENLDTVVSHSTEKTLDSLRVRLLRSHEFNERLRRLQGI